MIFCKKPWLFSKSRNIFEADTAGRFVPYPCKAGVLWRHAGYCNGRSHAGTGKNACGGMYRNVQGTAPQSKTGGGVTKGEGWTNDSSERRRFLSGGYAGMVFTTERPGVSCFALRACSIINVAVAVAARMFSRSSRASAVRLTSVCPSDVTCT